MQLGSETSLLLGGMVDTVVAESGAEAYRLWPAHNATEHCTRAICRKCLLTPKTMMVIPNTRRNSETFY